MERLTIPRVRTVEQIEAEIEKWADDTSTIVRYAMLPSLQKELIQAITDGIPIEHLKAICQAEKEGRLDVWPCRVDEYVWVTRAYGTILNPPVKATTDWMRHNEDGTLEVGLRMDLNGKGRQTYGYRVDAFGKIVFASEEAAEAALRKEQGE